MEEPYLGCSIANAAGVRNRLSQGSVLSAAYQLILQSVIALFSLKVHLGGNSRGCECAEKRGKSLVVAVGKLGSS